MKILKTIIVSLAAVLSACAPVQAQATLTCDFLNITNNNAVNAVIGEVQLSIDITGVNNNIARFTFSNTGPADSVIAKIYFEDTSGLMDFHSFDTFEPGIQFKKIKKHLNLPGGNEPFVDFTESYGFAAKRPAPQNGIGPGESLGILFSLEDTDFTNLVNNIQEGQVRIGVQTISFPDGGSESFINYCPGDNVLIPAPAAFTLCLIGTTFAAFLRRKNTI